MVSATVTTVTGAGVTLTVPAAQYCVIRLRTDPAAATVPADAAAAQIGVSVNRFDGSAGTSNLTATVAANTGEARTGNIVLKSKAGSATYSVAVTQTGISGNISVDTPTIAAGYVNLPVSVNVISVGAWSASQWDAWITPSVTTGPNGTTAVTLTIADNTSNDARTGTITFRNDQTEDIAVVTINQGGLPQSILLGPLRITGAAAGGNVTKEVIVISQHIWVMGSAPSWVATSPAAGAEGQTVITVTYDTPNNTGVKRSGYLRLENTTTHEIAICLIEQEG